MEERIKNLIEKEINPNLRADGGSAEFVEFKDGILKIRLHGACATCPYSAMTLSGVVETALKSSIPEIKKVEPVQ